jgi:hypothetical protein
MRKPMTTKLTVAQTLTWADAHHARTGAWPRRDSGPVAGAPGETWVNIDQAMKKGLRGLPGGDTLARLLTRARGVRNPSCLTPLTEKKIVAWAREHRRRTDAWPTTLSGPVAAQPGERCPRSTPPCARAPAGCRAVPRWAGCWPGAAAFPARPSGRR